MDADTTVKDWPYPFWIAHRGAGKLAPENTLAAFRLGAEMGFRAFECDVKLSKDGIPFLLHDSTLQRTTSAQGLASAQPWESLSTLDAGSWHSDIFHGEPLPSLAAIIDFCLSMQATLNIEIKPSPGAAHETGRVVAESAARLWTGRVAPPLISSFDIETLRSAMKAAPELPRALLLHTLAEDWLEAALSLDVTGVVLRHTLIDPDLITRLHGHGLRVLAYTVNDVSQARGLSRAGVDGIITDALDIFRFGISGE